MKHIMSETQSEMIKSANEYVERYSDIVIETYRPKFHLLPPMGWINDPNGFCLYKGKYHLYYQFFPYSPTNTKMYWAHSESDDLVNWDFLGTALAPDMPYDNEGVFSGTALVEGDNMTLMYTGVARNADNEIRQTQCLAYSNNGITIKKDENNPVINYDTLPANSKPEDFRDPKLWKKDQTYYCLTVAVDFGGFGKLLLYKSIDLIKWDFVSVMLSGENLNLGNLWECPDMFSIDSKDIVVVSTGQVKPRDEKFNHINAVVYFVGKLDYETGIYTYEYYDQLDDGSDFYAPQTIVGKDGKFIIIAWQSCWARNNPTAELGHGWAGNMTLPRELSLINGKIIQTVPKCIENHFKTGAKYKNINIKDNNISFSDVKGDCLKLSVSASVKNAEVFGVRFLKLENEYVELAWNRAIGLLTLDRSNAEYKQYGGEMEMNAAMKTSSFVGKDISELSFSLFLDKSAIDVFIDTKKRTLTSKAFTKNISNEIEFFSVGEVIFEIEMFNWNDLN